MRKVWMIRPASGKAYEDAALGGRVAADAGVRGDCSHILEPDEAMSLVIQENPGMKIGSQESRARSLFALVRDIHPGDLILVPLRHHRETLVAMARPESSVEDGLPARHVDILGRFAGPLPADVRNSMGAHACVCRLQAPDMEERIRAWLRGEVRDVGDGRCPWDGHDFAAIVAAALSSDGYVCQVSPPGPDGGVDIRAGKGLLGTESALIVQVKSSSGPVGIAEVDRLAGVLSARRGVSGLLVAWDGVSASASRRVSDLWPLIAVLDGPSACRAAFSSLDVVPEKLQSELTRWKERADG